MSASRSFPRCRTAAHPRRTSRCCSRRRAPTSRSNSAPCAATRRPLSRMLPTCGAKVSACSGTWRCRWRRAGCSRNGTPGAVGARNVAQFMSGPYRIPNIDIDVALQLTNKTPVGTYRGPGRFETDFFRERFFDIVAADLGIDRIEFRRRNLVAKADMPYSIATITPFEHKDEFDSGDY